MKPLLYSFGLFALLGFSSARADDSAIKAEDRADMEKDWTIELGSGATFGNVRTTGLDAYTLVPVDFTASLKVDDVSLDDFWGGVFRGYTEYYFRGFGMIVAKGIEDRIVGINMGPRYNFVQKDWPVVPFVEAAVGFGFADSRGAFRGTNQVGLGQDFCFQFGIAGGFRYDINDDWFTRLSVVYTHFSNAGLSEPARKNRAIDNAGPELALGYRF